MTNAEARFNKIHIRKVYACLAVTCHLHFWQNDRDFFRATVVTRGSNGYRNKSQHRKSTLEKKMLPWAVSAGLDLYIQAMPVGTYRVQSPGFPKIVYSHLGNSQNKPFKFTKSVSHSGISRIPHGNHVVGFRDTGCVRQCVDVQPAD